VYEACALQVADRFPFPGPMAADRNEMPPPSLPPSFFLYRRRYIGRFFFFSDDKIDG